MNKKKKVTFLTFGVVALVIILFIMKVYVASSYNEKGMKFYRDKKYDLAIENYRKAIKWKKRNLIYQINLASAYIENMQTEEAKRLINDMLRKNPDNSKLLILLGRVFITEENYPEAVKILSESIKNETNIANAYFHRGRAYIHLGKYEEALADFIQTAKLQPQYNEAYWKSIYVREKLNDLEGAILDYNKLEELKPGDYRVYEGRGKLRHDLENYNEALPDLLQAIKLNDTSGIAWYHAGRCYAIDADLPAAIKSFKKAADIHYKPDNANYNLGIAYFNQRKADSATYYFKKSLDGGDSTDVAYKSYYYLGDIQYNTGNPGKAVPYYTKSVQLSPDYAAAYYNRGNAYFNLKEYAKAEKDYKRCLSLGMVSGDVYYNLGALKIHQHEYKESCPYLKKASQLGSKPAQEQFKIYCNRD